MGYHALSFQNDGYEVTLTLKDPRGESLTHWVRLVEAVMAAIQTGEVVFPEGRDGIDLAELPPHWRTLRFRPERHGEVEVSTDFEAQVLSSMFGGISVHKGDRLTWGLGIEGDCS